MSWQDRLIRTAEGADIVTAPQRGEIASQHIDGCVYDAQVLRLADGRYQGQRLKGAIYKNAGEPTSDLAEAKQRALEAPFQQQEPS